MYYIIGTRINTSNDAYVRYSHFNCTFVQTNSLYYSSNSTRDATGGKGRMLSNANVRTSIARLLSVVSIVSSSPMHSCTLLFSCSFAACCCMLPSSYSRCSRKFASSSFIWAVAESGSYSSFSTCTALSISLRRSLSVFSSSSSADAPPTLLRAASSCNSSYSKERTQTIDR